ncbi:MAG: hypothetical protein DRP54_00595 [Spirochaetes bacterium]|nr:MAG: hypothetical protein DRP54_00595 [Spirochaetota bacterium]
MKSKYSITGLIILLGAAFILVFCGGRSEKAPLQLTFWHSMSIYQGNVLYDLINQYNEEHKDVVINPVFQGLYPDMKAKLLNATKTDNPPDIAQVAIEYLDIFIQNGSIQPITEYIPEEDKNDILDQFWRCVSRKLEVYAYPFNISVQVLYYNKDAFEEAGLNPEKPPKTWDEVIEYAKKLTKDFDGDGIIDQWGVLVSVEGVFGFTPLIRQLGGEVLNEDRTKAVFNNEKGVRVMNLLQDMIYKYRVMPSKWSLFEGTNAFLQGKIAMGPITSAGIKFAEENLPWKLGIAPLPYIENKSVLLGGAGLVVLSDSYNEYKQSLDFIRWLSSKENTIRWHKETGYLPLRKSAIESVELKSFYKAHPNYKVALDQLGYARPPDFTPYLPQIDQILRFAIDEILINKKEPKIILDIAAEKINELLATEEEQ